eukprot:CAMPEP_0201886862 /NCGR_PEP_ID=MMETSP0902-20130614/23416_1 /ASSEMBLY_ACC=CAM_ASM_000551 /TAXON_ID=420261 /ORGANISM="Thalassiosira antarctica, Strain CCMP982" /LENGTH=44 /DNA_ID= /DNA_START= /DNA_END= /DNA_ORIENTATION=
MPKRIPTMLKHRKYQLQTQNLGIERQGIDNGSAGKKARSHGGVV